MTRREAVLVLSDGTVFEGYGAGFSPESGVTSGEFVFNTSLSGYQEVITDPSYSGQIVTFTYPHVGNYGVSDLDDEAPRPWCVGVVMRELTALPSSWRSGSSLEDFLVARRVPAIVGVDTRRLTRHLRAHGSLAGAFGTAGHRVVAARAAVSFGTDGRDLASEVSTPVAYDAGRGDRYVVVVDFGVKRSMVRQLAERFRVTVVPSSTSASEILARRPDGVFLSNGPGDPAALEAPAHEVSQLRGRVPLFGICLRHQLLAAALGATTFNLSFGHHGSNHPVQDLASGRVEITAQNHNYAVAPDSLDPSLVSHINLNDGVIEGLSSPAERCFSVQYHPEASPGPHDSHYLFERFEVLVKARSGLS